MTYHDVAWLDVLVNDVHHAVAMVKGLEHVFKVRPRLLGIDALGLHRSEVSVLLALQVVRLVVDVEASHHVAETDCSST